MPTYGILNMPLRAAFEELMVEIEGGHRAVTLPSGLAAVAVALMACVKAGDHLLVTDSAYGPTRRFCQRTLARYGVETTFYDPLVGAGIAALMKPNTRAVYLESPGSLTFEVQDFPAIANVARERGAAVIHDNTWATGVFFRSFDHGADLVIQAATKYPAGHSDVLIGAVVANEAWWPRLRDVSRDLGQTASPDDLFLAMRGIRTLEARLKRHEASALQVAQWLKTHPAVKRVLHPALRRGSGPRAVEARLPRLRGPHRRGARARLGRSSSPHSSTGSSASRSATAGAATRASSCPPSFAARAACAPGRAGRWCACRSASRIPRTCSPTSCMASTA